MSISMIKTLLYPKKFYNTLENLVSLINNRISLKSNISKYPTFLSFELSSLCNLSCPECPCGMKMIKRDNQFLDFALYKSILEEVGNYLHTIILYFQGEPLLNKNFISFVTLAHQYHIYTTCSTNAQCINKKMAQDIVASRLKHLIISLDGIDQDTNEKYRKGASFQKTMKAIEYLNHYKKLFRTKYPIIELQMIVFRFNEEQIPEYKKMAHRLKVNKISFKTAQFYNQDTLENLIPKNKKYTRYILDNGIWKMKHSHWFICYRLWAGAVVTSDGLLLPCCYDKQAQYPFGSLKSEPLINLWKGNTASHFRKKLMSEHFNLDICNNCNQ